MIRLVFVAAVVLASACGARTAALEDDEPPSRDASVDRPDDGPPTPVSCDIDTVDAPIVASPRCLSPFESCRPTVESALIVPAGCGELPRGVWTGTTLLVAWNGSRAAASGDGVILATLGLDGRVREHSEVIPDQADGRRPSMSFGDTVGVLGGSSGIAWFDDRGGILGVVPLERAPADPAVRVTRDPAGVFRAMAVDASQPYLSPLGERPSEPLWMRFAGGDIRQGELVEDRAGLGQSAALLGRNLREIQHFPLSGRSRFQRFGWDVNRLDAALALGDRIFSVHATTDPSAAEGPGLYLARDDAFETTRISPDASRGGADFLAVDDGFIVAFPTREGDQTHLSLAALDPEPVRVEEAIFVLDRGAAPRAPDLVPVPDGFVLLRETSAGILLDVFQCCSP